MQFLITLSVWLSSPNASPEVKAKGFWRFYKEQICEHPFNERANSMVAIQRQPKDNNIRDYNYVVRVCECGFCGKHYIDEGLEFKDRDFLKGGT